ncbi:P63C domain-containing protein [Methylocucumis oryzae]|uniref:P63C domain-containing protein n=1 Tax=Methylocucumis oryzae TaxID=1632867 RepID=UPI0009E20E66|nr:P63C domain-containing protein [Methylocucumis oryzae]
MDSSRKNNKIDSQQNLIAETLIRGFARVGISALVDEATGYQKDREKDALAKILEAFVAKELQPWIKTFDHEFYENMFRLRGIPYPPKNSNYKPSYFGHLTNDIVYRRLAPGVFRCFKRRSKKGRKENSFTSTFNSRIWQARVT